MFQLTSFKTEVQFQHMDPDTDSATQMGVGLDPDPQPCFLVHFFRPYTVVDLTLDVL
jgi:hypothetical protein